MIYTAIVGGYDPPRGDIKCFTEKLFKDNNRSAKIYKILAHEYIEEEYSIWVDGNIFPLKSEDELIKKYLGDADIAVSVHPHRKTIFEELKACIKFGKDDPKIMEEQVEKYKQKGFDGTGLCECGVLIRRHNERTKKFNEMWWQEIVNGSKRDQLSFPFVAWLMPDIKINHIVPPVRKNPDFKFVKKHAGAKKKLPAEVPFTKYKKKGDYHWQTMAKNPGHIYGQHVEKIKSWIKEKNVLDIGCGDGYITQFIGAKGIDPDEDGVRYARQHGIEATVGTVYDVTGQYEAVFMGDVIEHLSDPGAALEKLKEITNKVYITTPRKQPGKLGMGHVQEWTPEEFTAFVSEHDWVETSSEVANRTIYSIIERTKYIDDGKPPVTDEVRDFLEEKIKEIKPKRALEFGTGSGKATAIISKHADEVVTMDEKQAWLDTAKKNNPDLKNVTWKAGYDTEGLTGKFDFVFVDGPMGKNRRHAAFFKLIDFIDKEAVIILDDCRRKNEALILTDLAQKHGYKTEYLEKGRGIGVADGRLRTKNGIINTDKFEMLHTTGFSGTNYGAWMNKIMASAPCEWVVFTDHDAYLSNPNWYAIIQKHIKNTPDAGLFSCVTNRLGNPQQKAVCDQNNHDMLYHHELAQKIEKNGKLFQATRPLSGIMMVTSKTAWQACGGFKEKGIIGVDNNYHKRIVKAGYKAYIMGDLYMYHRYRAMPKGAEAPKASAVKISSPEKKKAGAVFCSYRIDGGGNQSGKKLATLLNYDFVNLHTEEWKEAKGYKKQIWYMNDDIYKLNGKDNKEFINILKDAEDIKVCLNFVIGGTHKANWVDKFPVKKILFLNKQRENEWTQAVHGTKRSLIPTVALCPPVNIEHYEMYEPRKDDGLIRIGRHSRISLKYPDDPGALYREINKPTREFHFMLAHPKIEEEFTQSNFKYYKWNQTPVPDFLKQLDVWLCIIHPNTKEQGPRTLAEAMLAGCVCIAEDRDGPTDKIIDNETGFLVKDPLKEVPPILNMLEAHKGVRKQIGQAAREYALKNFHYAKWIDELK